MLCYFHEAFYVYKSEENWMQNHSHYTQLMGPCLNLKQNKTKQTNNNKRQHYLKKEDGFGRARGASDFHHRLAMAQPPQARQQRRGRRVRGSGICSGGRQHPAQHFLSAFMAANPLLRPFHRSNLSMHFQCASQQPLKISLGKKHSIQRISALRICICIGQDTRDTDTGLRARSSFRSITSNTSHVALNRHSKLAQLKISVGWVGIHQCWTGIRSECLGLSIIDIHNGIKDPTVGIKS